MAQQYEEGAEVVTADGQEVGQVDRVVLNPSTKGVTHLVVRKGLLFKTDKVIPIEWVREANAEKVVLDVHTKDLDDLPEFEFTQYVDVATQDLADFGYSANFPRPVYWYPPYTLSGGFGGYPYPMQPVETVKNIPEDTVALKEGAEVVTTDGRKAGSIERIIVDSKTNQATHFLVSSGLIQKERKVIPASWVEDVEEDKVHLRISSEMMERLPDYQER